MRFIIYTLLFIISIAAQGQQLHYPSDIEWKNLKTDYGAVGDGVTDDTEAFRNAFTTYMNPYQSRIVLFVPNGTYLVSDSIRTLNGFYDCCLTLQGQNKDSTIIKLKDNAPFFQDQNNPRPVFYTRDGNQAFSMYFFDMTINTGLSNEGAVGLDYITSNNGSVKNVKIISPDASGFVGIDMIRSWPGPGIIKNVTVDGFKYGSRVNTCEYSMTFEDFTVNNASITGLEVNCNTVAIRKYTTNNVQKAIDGTGYRIAMIESSFNNGNSTNYAINVPNSSVLFARDITSSGYAGILFQNGITNTSLSIDEIQTGVDYSIFENNGKSLDLPVEETPNYVNNDLNTWANVKTYGALTTNPLYGYFDATPGIQAALNSEKKVIYLSGYGDNGSGYCIYSDIVIPPTVEAIKGFTLSRFIFFNNSKFVINSDAASPLFIEGISPHIHNNSQRTVVFKNTNAINYTNTALNAHAKVFAEDFVSHFRPDYPVKLWARHLNSEVQPENETNLNNNGGSYWILGYKTEGRANLLRSFNGGATEILGSLVYPSSSFSGSNQAAFVTHDSHLSLAGLTMTSYAPNGWYGVAVVEKHGTTSDTLQGGTIWSNTPYNFSFYRTGDSLTIAAKQDSGQFILNGVDASIFMKNELGVSYKISVVNNQISLAQAPTPANAVKLSHGNLMLDKSIVLTDATNQKHELTVSNIGTLQLAIPSAIASPNILLENQNLEVIDAGMGIVLRSGSGKCWRLHIEGSQLKVNRSRCD